MINGIGELKPRPVFGARLSVALSDGLTHGQKITKVGKTPRNVEKNKLGQKIFV